jgi:transposase
MSAADSLPDDIDALKQLVRARDAELVQARARASSDEALIAHLRLAIEKMRREMYGSRSERKARLLDQMELQLEELEASAAEDELAAEQAAPAATTQVRAFTRRNARTPAVSGMPIPEQAARDSGMMPPTHSEIIPPVIPR